MRLSGMLTEISTNFLAAMRFRDYRIMWVATMSDAAATWGLIVARGTVVYTISGSSAMVGVVTFMAMIPLLFAPPLAGFMADRFDRKRMLIVSFTINMIHNIFLVILFFSGLLEIWHVIALSLVNGVGRAIEMPAGQALVPNLVPQNILPNAVALNAATIHSSRLLGPLLNAPIIAAHGVGWAFVLCTGLYAFSLIVIPHIKTKSSGVIDEKAGIGSNLLSGLKYTYSHKILLPLVLMVGLHCCFTMSFESMLPLLTRVKLDMGESGFSQIMMAV